MASQGGFNDAVKYHLTGMYQDWFLDYASYVILELQGLVRSLPGGIYRFAR